MYVISFLLSKLKRESGQSLVEFALVIPIFLLLIVAVIDFSWLSLGQIQITNATQEAARYYAKTENIGVTRDEINTALKAVVVQNVDSIKAEDITVTSSNPSIDQIHINVSAKAPSLTKLMSDWITISRDVTMRTEY